MTLGPRPGIRRAGAWRSNPVGRLALPCILGLAGSLGLSCATAPALDADAQATGAIAPRIQSRASALPEVVETLDKAEVARLETLLDRAVEIRGLQPLRPIEAGRMPASELPAELERQVRAEFDASETQAAERALQIFGLLPPGLDLETTILELLGGEIAAFYDLERDYLAFVDREPNAADPAADDEIWVHELVHALQDQHFSIDDEPETAVVADRPAALAAVVEGDGMYSMLHFALGLDPVRIRSAEEILAALEGQDLTGDGDALSEAPRYLRESLLFPYIQGLRFNLMVHAAGGYALVDHALGKGRPVSTEQILSPERWLAGDDEPIVITLEDHSGDLGVGWRRALVADHGQLSIQLLFREHGLDETAATAAAAGWGGDAWALYTREEAGPDDAVVAWVTDWDSRTDADKFFAAIAPALADWTFNREGPVRVVGVSPGLAEAPRARLLEALAAAPAAREAPRPIDLTALGIEAEDRPASIDTTDIRQMMAVPALRDQILGELRAASPELFELYETDPEQFYDLMQDSMDAQARAQGPGAQPQ